MAGGKHFKKLEKGLARLGYEFSHHAGSRGSMWVFSHDTLPELTINPSLDENAARQILRKVEKSLGVLEKAPKRNAAAIKERQAVERERQVEELARLNAERAKIAAERDALLAGAGAHLSNRDIAALEARIREIETERRELERLMNAPVTGIHDSSRTARHTA